MATEKKIAYPISRLDQYSSDLNTTTISTLLMELVVDEYGNGVHSNKKATFQSFGDFLISAHPIFNKIDEIYNDRTIIDQDEQTGETIYRYHADIYLSGQTYFNTNPYSYDGDKSYIGLNSHQTVQKRQIEQYIHDNGLEVDPIGTYHNCYYAVPRGTISTTWTKASPDPYMSDNLKAIVPFQNNIESSNCYKLEDYINDGKLVGTNIVSFRNNKNRFVTVIGKVKVPFGLNTGPYYTPEVNLWAAAYDNNSRGVVAVTELHNYRSIGQNTHVAYFSMQFPIVVNQEIRVVIPFVPEAVTNDDRSKDNLSYDIFRNIPINSVCFLYYSKS